MLYSIPYAMLTSYCLSGALMEHFAIYPGWQALSIPTAITKTHPLITAHSTQSPGILYIYALPKLVLTGCIIAQVTYSPTATNLFSLAMLSTSWLSSFFVQIPLQQKIRASGDREAVEKLVLTDWVRVLTMAGHFAGVALAVAS